MIRESVHEIRVDADPDAVFDFLNDLDRLRSWQVGVIEVHPDPPGPLAAGSRIAKVRRTPLGTQRFTDVIDSLDARERRRTDRVPDGAVAGTRSEWHVTPDGEGSRLRLTIRWQVAGLARLLGPLIISGAIRQMNGEIERFKHLAEGGPTAGQP